MTAYAWSFPTIGLPIQREESRYILNPVGSSLLIFHTDIYIYSFQSINIPMYLMAQIKTFFINQNILFVCLKFQMFFLTIPQSSYLIGIIIFNKNKVTDTQTCQRGHS